MMDDYADAALLSCGLIALFFTFKYATGSRWRANRVGRALMYMMASFTLTLGVISASVYFGDYPGREIVRAIFYTGLNLTLIGLFRVLILHQRRRDDDPIGDATECLRARDHR